MRTSCCHRGGRGGLAEGDGPARARRRVLRIGWFSFYRWGSCGPARRRLWLRAERVEQAPGSHHTGGQTDRWTHLVLLVAASPAGGRGWEPWQKRGRAESFVPDAGEAADAPLAAVAGDAHSHVPRGKVPGDPAITRVCPGS